VNLGISFLLAENGTNGRIFTRLHPVLPSVNQIKVHLTGIGVAELSDYGVDDHQAAETAVKED